MIIFGPNLPSQKNLTVFSEDNSVRLFVDKGQTDETDILLNVKFKESSFMP